MMPDLTDTDKRVLVKDHDILIAVYTQLADMSRRFDENVRYQQENSQTLATELKGLAVEQARVSTQLKSVEVEQEQIGKRMDRMESKSNVWDVVNSFGVLVSAYIGYVFGNR